LNSSKDDATSASLFDEPTTVSKTKGKPKSDRSFTASPEATAIVKKLFEREPRPMVPYVAVLKQVQAALDAGYPPGVVESVTMQIPTYSANSFQLALSQTSVKRDARVGAKTSQSSALRDPSRSYGFGTGEVVCTDVTGREDW
jgi:hypothetical protein